MVMCGLADAAALAVRRLLASAAWRLSARRGFTGVIFLA
jgi:hypothetical protein